MDELKIKLLYCEYGWSPKQIADALSQQQTYVQMVIDENEWLPPPPPTLPASTSALTIEDDIDPTIGAVQKLKEQEVLKQTMLAPLVAVAEMSLLGKLMEAIDHLDPSADGAHNALTNMVKAFKQLQQDSVTTSIANDQNDKPGIAIQVITQIQ